MGILVVFLEYGDKISRTGKENKQQLFLYYGIDNLIKPQLFTQESLIFSVSNCHQRLFHTYY